mgnify:FL=1
MFIEKLTDEEVKKIAKILISIVEEDEDKLKFKMDNLKIDREFYRDTIYCSFPTAYEWHGCFLSDFDASMTYGGYEAPAKIKKTYRKIMYKKFGVEYKQNFDSYYRSPIEQKYKKDLESLDNEINEMIN